uniref:hypothetical protein n=1 Tax=Streptomyces sp. sk226 TaxID=2034268 RepID=UPI001C54E939
THHPTRNRMSSLGPDQKDSLSAAPSDTQQRARHNALSITFHAEAVLATNQTLCRIVNVPPMSYQHRTFAGVLASDQTEAW